MRYGKCSWNYIRAIENILMNSLVGNQSPPNKESWIPSYYGTNMFRMILGSLKTIMYNKD